MEDKFRELDLKTTLGIAFALVAAYYFFYYKPPSEVLIITQLEQELIQLDTEIKKLDLQIAEGNDLGQKLEAYKKEIKAFSTYFDKKDNSKTIQQVISDEARSVGLSFTTLTSKEPQFDPQDIEYDINGALVQKFNIKDYIGREIIHADFTGSFTQLMRFLSYLSKTDRVISLKSIDISGDASNGKTTSAETALSYSADFEAYSILKDVNAEDLAPDPEPVIISNPEEIAQ